MDLRAEQTSIPGQLVIRLPVHLDDRGWFKENWQREKMVALGLPDFGPVQNNVAYNARRGVTRGFHAEPWDKLVSVAAGRVHGAWVDLRDGPSFGTVHEVEIDPGTAVFVPRGVANAYQALDDATAYVYLVNDHWRPGTEYPAVHLGDPELAVDWPVPLDQADLSDKDRSNPPLRAVDPVPRPRPLVTGAGGQLGRALLHEFPDAVGVTRHELDISDPGAVAAWPWHDHDVVLNAAAFTAVDQAETTEGRAAAWRTNAWGTQALARAAADHRLTLVHYSTDYVFDGRRDRYTEEDETCPLGVYGQSKAAGELCVKAVAQHYLIRTSWVVGDGSNFVRTMARLADRGVHPEVIDDQTGRLTFADELARATRHLVDRAPFGTYNVSNSGDVTSWADIARTVFRLRGRDPDDVARVTTEHYGVGRVMAPRPRSSTLDLTRLVESGFRPADALTSLERYVRSFDLEPESAP